MPIGWLSKVVLLLTLTTFLGCSGTPPPAIGSDSEVKRLGVIYMRYVGMHMGQSPPSREEFEKFVGSLQPEDLKALGIKDPKASIVSSRDKEPIVVRYGIPIPPPGPGDPVVVAYEAKGVNGKRLVVFGTAGVEEVTEERLKKLVPDAK